MFDLSRVIVAAIFAVVLISLIILFIYRWCCSKKPSESLNRSTSLQEGISRLHQTTNVHNQNSYQKIKRSTSQPMFFSWSDNPSLVTDAVENGWSRFAFTKYVSSKTNILGLCTSVSDNGREFETGWEVCKSSSEFMQKISLGPGLKKPAAALTSVIRAALPLPGPMLLDSCSFPQEAYFEIRILNHDDNKNGAHKEGEKIKLMISDSLKIGLKEDVDKGQVAMLSLGLAGGSGGSLPLKPPGTYPGSIGFSSSGAVYLDGIKLVFESEKGEWGKPEKVIGCGYDPRKKTVYFTVDSELVHVIHCKAEIYGTPLYPTLAANGDISVLVNFGQSVFEYAPANAHRTTNPCFIESLRDTTAAAFLSYEDSNELFSMGRIDSQWLNRCITKNSCNNNGKVASDFDEESDAELFEIVLERSGRSSNTIL